MSLNELGPWCVVWLVKCTSTGSSQIAHAFFNRREDALDFQRRTGGELYLKLTDGTLRRNG